jgi:hypothetical protein
MLIVHVLAFDDIISGTAVAWYTPSRLNASLGAADAFAVQAVTRFVSGTDPTLTVLAEHSADQLNWVATPTPEINAVPLVGDDTFDGARDGATDLALLGFLRFRISLGGVSPQCRLKLYVTGRVRAGRA